MFNKIVFAGTPDIASSLLKDLIINNYNIIAAYTQPDRPKGRNQKLELSPVKQIAITNKIPILQPTTLKDPSIIKHLQKLNPDLLIVFAYGLILPQEILTIPKFGCFNVHTSLLPKYRGAAPIQHSILNGEQVTGISIIKMDPSLDTGDIWYAIKCEITEEDTTASLQTKLQPLATKAMLHVLKNFHNITPIPQNHKLATYAHKIKKSDAKINWLQSAKQIERQIKAFTPNPIAFTEIKNFSVNKEDHLPINIRIWQAKALSPINKLYINNTNDENIFPGKILNINKHGITVATGDGTLILEKVQFPGSKILNVSELINANKYKHLLDYSEHFM